MVTHKVVHDIGHIQETEEIAVRSQFEPVHMKVKNGVEMGFKLALGFWLFSIIFWVVIGAILMWSGVPLPFLPKMG